jgi:hypothetical protein
VVFSMASNRRNKPAKQPAKPPTRINAVKAVDRFKLYILRFYNAPPRELPLID